MPRSFTSGDVLRCARVRARWPPFLLYYVGPRDIAETTLKVVLAVVLTAALWVGANLLFDQAYAHWTRFNTIIGAAVGFVGYFVAEANGTLHTLIDEPVRVYRLRACSTTSPDGRREPFDVNASAVGTHRRRRARSRDVPAQRPAPAARPAPLVVVGFTAFGLLTAFALDESALAGRSTGASSWICVARRRGRCSALIGLWR